MINKTSRFIALFPTFILCSVVNAQTVESPESSQPPAPPAEADKCDQTPDQDKFPEKMQSTVHEASCRTVRWLDGLFGDSEEFQEESVGGKLSIGMSWNQYESAKAKARFRLRSDLPNFNSRWNAFLGRVEEDAYISDTETLQESAFRDGIANEDDPEWLLGLGYDDRGGARKGWDYSIGVRLRTPIRTYVKARYRTETTIWSAVQLKYRQTIFWRDGIGFGTTSHIDTVRNVGTEDLLRLELLGTITESSLGTQWYTGYTWYHRLHDQSGISLLSFARGETDHESPLQEYGFELTWRRKLTRDWLFINVGPTLTWPKLNSNEVRESSLGFAVLIDFKFGSMKQ